MTTIFVFIILTIASSLASGPKAQNCGQSSEKVKELTHLAFDTIKKTNSYLKGSEKDDLLIRKYFGGPKMRPIKEHRLNQIKIQFQKLERITSRQMITFVCTNLNLSAKTIPGLSNKIWLGQNFFEQFVNDAVVTLIHEFSHEFLWKGDKGYREDIYVIAQGKQFRNAENFAYFAVEAAQSIKSCANVHDSVL